ncbi:hypothetical protein ACMFMF_001315 [Clarireedia jacksonii]
MSQRPVHIAMFLYDYNPDTGKPCPTGKEIHAEGDARNGFGLLFKRNHDLDRTDRGLRQTQINIADRVTAGQIVIQDTTAMDTFERLAFNGLHE